MKVFLYGAPDQAHLLVSVACWVLRLRELSRSLASGERLATPDELQYRMILL